MTHSGPLSTHANRTMNYDKKHYWETCEDNCGPSGGFSWAGALILFIIVLFIVWALIFWANPEALQHKDKDDHYDGKADLGKSFVAALIFTFLLFVIFGLFGAACSR